MSAAGDGNPFWKVGPVGTGLPRRTDLTVVEERGQQPVGHRLEPTFPDRDWIGAAQQGGGRVPPGDNWRESPTERQDRSMGDATRRLE
jgi:hypothetical protein